MKFSRAGGVPMLRENRRAFASRQVDAGLVTKKPTGKLSNVTASAMCEGRAFLCLRNPHRQIKLIPA